MSDEPIPEAALAQIAELVAERFGLHFPSERRADLARGLHAASQELRFADVARFVRQLLSGDGASGAIHALASHLTVGETYFLREPKTLEALSQRVLPELLARSRASCRPLRVWSAACSTGEEAYSLAILLRRLVSDPGDHPPFVLATDINERALEKAAAGIYGEWSFRAAPREFRDLYFVDAGGGRSAIRPEIKASVTFAHLNLAADGLLPPQAREMDLILCRNVLLYFTPRHARRLVGKLEGSLAEGGWLAVSPSECSQTLFSSFAVENFPGAILYRKSGEAVRQPPDPRPRSDIALGRPASRAFIPAEASAWPAPHRQECLGAAPSEPADRVLESSTADRARELADAGHLQEALPWSEQWAASDKINPAAHYLHATVLRELGHRDAARRAFQRCIYLEPDLTLAHFALGQLEQEEGNHADARRYFETARRLLRACPAEAVLAETNGLTAGSLAAIVEALLSARRDPSVSIVE